MKWLLTKIFKILFQNVENIHGCFFLFFFLKDALKLKIIYFFLGTLCMITGGRNLGRVGTVTHRERHPGSFDIVHVKDSLGHSFATR